MSSTSEKTYKPQVEFNKQPEDNGTISVTPPIAPHGQVQALEISQTFVHSGPIPSADELIKYQNIDVDVPNRIIIMAEKEQLNTHENDRVEREVALSNVKRADRQIEIDRENRILAMICATVVIVLLLSSAVFCAYIKQPLTASVIGGGGLCAIIATIVLGTKNRQ